jgi:hypothetical protein
MENTKLIKFGENKITLKENNETFTFEILKIPNYIVGSQYLDFEGGRYFLTKRKP